MIPEIAKIIVLVLLLLMAIIYLIGRRIKFPIRISAQRRPLEAGMGVLGWGMIFVLAILAFFTGLLWLFVIPFIAVFIHLQNLRGKQQGFLWIMALAAERNIPLVPAIEAYARETGGLFGYRVAELAELLKSGVPLPDALSRIPQLVPERLFPIIRTGFESGALASGLREAAAARDLQQSLWGAISAKMLYLVAMIWFGSIIVTFIMIKIMPCFEKIFQDFHSQLPPITKTFLGASHQALVLWPLLFLMVIFFFFLFCYSLLKYLGISLFDLPGMGRFMRRKHTAEILDNLAMVVEHDRPLLQGVHTLSECYPQIPIRAKLIRALFEIQQGAVWSESLFRQKLIRQSDMAVLQAAERAGNLPWAMRELADSNRRRLAYRANAVVQLLFPPVVFCFGAMVLFVVVAIFMPLITLIGSFK